MLALKSEPGKTNSQKLTPEKLTLKKQFIYKPIRNPMRISSRVCRFAAWPVPAI